MASKIERIHAIVWKEPARKTVPDTTMVAATVNEIAWRAGAAPAIQMQIEPRRRLDGEVSVRCHSPVSQGDILQ